MSGAPSKTIEHTGNSSSSSRRSSPAATKRDAESATATAATQQQSTAPATYTVTRREPPRDEPTSTVARPRLGSSLTSRNASSIAAAAARRGQRVEWARSTGDPSLELVATSDISIDPESVRRPGRRDVGREARIQRFLDDTDDVPVMIGRPAPGAEDAAQRSHLYAACSVLAEMDKLFPSRR